MSGYSNISDGYRICLGCSTLVEAKQECWNCNLEAKSSERRKRYRKHSVMMAIVGLTSAVICYRASPPVGEPSRGTTE